MTQFRFDSCASYFGLSPDVEVRRVVFEPPQNAEEADIGTGIITVNSSFFERIVNEAQDTWFEDIEAQKYISTRVVVFTEAEFSQLFVRVVNIVNAHRRGDVAAEQEFTILANLYSYENNGAIFDFNQAEADIAASILGVVPIDGESATLTHVHQNVGPGAVVENVQIHPARTHEEMYEKLALLKICVDLLQSETIEQGRNDQIRQISANRINVDEMPLTRIVTEATQIEKTIGDDGEEIRRANLPLSTFTGIPLLTDHVSVFSFSYVRTDAIASDLNISRRLRNASDFNVDFTYSKIDENIVASSVYIRPILITAEQIEQADQTVLAPQASKFQDVRGLYALSGQAPSGDASQAFTFGQSGILDSPVDLAGFEDEIRSMSVEINEEVYPLLAREATVFSDLWVSRRRNYEVDLAFAFNEQRFMQQNSLFPKIFNSERFAEMARNLGSGITRMQIFKHQVNPNNNVIGNSLGTTSRNVRSYQNQSRELIGALIDEQERPNAFTTIREFTYQINFGASNEIFQGMRFFTATDFHRTEQQREDMLGKSFEYGVEIDFKDASTDLLLYLTNYLLEKENTLRKLVNDMGTIPTSIPEERDAIHGRVNDERSRTLLFSLILNALSESGVIQEGRSNYQDLISDLFGSPDMDLNERAEGIQRVADLLAFFGGEIENELRRAVPGIQVYPGDDSPENANAYSQGSNTGVSAPRSIVTKVHTFKNILNPPRGEGYDYLNRGDIPNLNLGIQVKSIQQFLLRANQENDKYFNNMNAIAGIEDTKIKYFTPATLIDLAGENIIQTPETMYDYERYTNFLANVINGYSRTEDSGETRTILPDGPNTNSINTTETLTSQLERLGATVSVQAPSINRNVSLASLAAFSNVAFGAATGSEGNLQQADIDQQADREQFVRLQERFLRQIRVIGRNIAKPLVNILGPIEVSSRVDDIVNERKNSFTKVVLDISEDAPRFLEDISELPNQIKAMIKIVSTKFNAQGEQFLNYNYDFDDIREIRGPRGTLLTLTDPMRDYHKFASYWLNFKQIKKVEILSSFNRTSNNGYDVANPVWREIDIEDVNNLQVGQIMLCRFGHYTSTIAELLGITSNSSIELPIYSEYFFLTRREGEVGLLVTDDQRTEGVVIDASLNPSNMGLVRQGELERLRSQRDQLSEQVSQFDAVDLMEPVDPVQPEVTPPVPPVPPLVNQTEELGEVVDLAPPVVQAPTLSLGQQFEQIGQFSFNVQQSVASFAGQLANVNTRISDQVVTQNQQVLSQTNQQTSQMQTNQQRTQSQASQQAVVNRTTTMASLARTTSLGSVGAVAPVANVGVTYTPIRGGGGSFGGGGGY